MAIYEEAVQLGWLSTRKLPSWVVLNGFHTLDSLPAPPMSSCLLGEVCSQPWPVSSSV